MSGYNSTRFYWLQLKEDFFDEDAIEWLEDQPNGAEQAYFYLKLCLKSLKTDGLLIRRVGEMLIPYDAERLSKMTGTNPNVVQAAIVNLKMCGLVEQLENGTLYLTQVAKMVGHSSIGAFKKQQQRALKGASKPAVSCEQSRIENDRGSSEDSEGGQMSAKVSDRTRTRVRTRDRNKKVIGGEKPFDDFDLIADQVGSEFDEVEPQPQPVREDVFDDLELTGDMDPDMVPASIPAKAGSKLQGRIPNCPFEGIVSLYHEMLPELPRTVMLTAKRRGWINARWRAVCVSEAVKTQKEGLEVFKSYFELVKKSPFLMGMKQPGKGHSRTFKADLEWLMNESNFTKVIEGKYA